MYIYIDARKNISIHTLDFGTQSSTKCLNGLESSQLRYRLNYDLHTASIDINYIIAEINNTFISSVSLYYLEYILMINYKAFILYVDRMNC